MKVYSLYSWENGANYFLSVADAESTDNKSIVVILNIQELVEHASYKISLIKPSNHESTTVVIHGGFLTMDNLTTIAFNFANNIDDILTNIEPYEIAISQ